MSLLFFFEPEFDFRRFCFKASGMDGTDWHMVPVSCGITGLLVVHHQNEFTLGDNANIVSVVGMGWDFCAAGVAGEEDAAVLGGEFVSVEGAVKLW